MGRIAAPAAGVRCPRQSRAGFGHAVEFHGTWVIVARDDQKLGHVAVEALVRMWRGGRATSASGEP